MIKRLKRYLSNNYSFGLIIVFFFFQLVARYLFVNILLLIDIPLIPYMWLWGRLLGHYVFLYLPSTYIQKSRRKARLNLSRFFMLFLLVDMVVYLMIRIPQVLPFIFIYFVVRDKEIKIRRNYMFYFFIFATTVGVFMNKYLGISETGDIIIFLGLIALFFFFILGKKKGGE